MSLKVMQKQGEKNPTLIIPPTVTDISWEAFQEEYLTREDGYKYEWLNGRIEQTHYMMNRDQAYIIRNLFRVFRQLLKEDKVDGELIPELDLFFEENHRRPDICWLTDPQIDALATQAKEVPAFVIEIVSTHDQVNQLGRKMNDYRAAKVQVVWHIFPELEEVHVFRGKNLNKMLIHTGAMKCSAKPALPAFEMKVNAIFKKK